MTEYEIKTGDVNVRIPHERVAECIKAKTYANDDVVSIAGALAILDSINSESGQAFGVVTEIVTLVDGINPNKDDDSYAATNALLDMNVEAGLIEKREPTP